MNTVVPQLKILIVEDESIIAADLKDTLEEMGYAVCGTTGYGEAALEMAEKDLPDLVLMDIQLKGEMNGIEAALELKKRVAVPVVFLSAFSDEAMLEEAEKAEPFGYLVKPFQAQELNATIRMASCKAALEKKLLEANEKLQKALDEVKLLSGLIPICSSCKKIRDSKDYWRKVEDYIASHSEARFTHSICPDCIKELYPDLDFDKDE